MENDPKQNRTRRIGGNILIALPGLILVMSGMVKFAHVPAVVAQMAASGFAGGKLTLVAALELLSAGLFLYPRARSVGVLVLSSFLGGAICTHVQLGEYAKVLPTFILLSLVWIGTWLRHPEVLWSLSPAWQSQNNSAKDAAKGGLQRAQDARY
jgi:DoxX-like protein